MRSRTGRLKKPRGAKYEEARSGVRNQVQLIAYVDRLSDGGFRELRAMLDGPFAGLFGGVHLLPFYWPIDGADAGFDPIDHTKVDQRLGSWDDVRSLSRVVDIMADLIGRPEERQQMNAAEQAGERAIEKLLKFTHAAAGKAIDISNQLDLVFHTRCSISSSRMRAVSG